MTMRLPTAGLTVETIQAMRTVAKLYRFVCQRTFGMRREADAFRSHDIAGNEVQVDYTVDLARELRRAFALEWNYSNPTTMQARFEQLGVCGVLSLTANYRPGARAVWTRLRFEPCTTA